MWDCNAVISIEYRNDYMYHVAFDDGVEGEVDLSEFLDLGPVFDPLKDPQYFR